MSNNNSWVAMDWGSTKLRAWLIEEVNIAMKNRQSKSFKILAKRESNDGVSSVEDFCLAFAKITKGWDIAGLPVIACGMVGSKNGWQEVPYLKTPIDVVNIVKYISCLSEKHRVKLRKKVKQMPSKIYLVPGIAQYLKNSPEVMRGEETLLLGINSLISKTKIKLNSIVIMPGTHSKWVWLKNNKVEKIKTFMSGELFNVLTNYSLLKYSTIPSKSNSALTNLEQLQFRKGVQMSKTQLLSAQLFSIRAHGLLFGHEPKNSRNRLSGMIIGEEVKWGMEQIKLNQQNNVSSKPDLYLIGNDALNPLYKEALKIYGYTKNLITEIDSHIAVLTGLYQMYKCIIKLKKY